MKKLFILMLAFAMIFMVACAPAQESAAPEGTPVERPMPTEEPAEETAEQPTEESVSEEPTEETNEDVAYVQEKGTLVVGVTEFAPMYYLDAETNEYVGFDIELAAMFAEQLGVSVEYQVIDWSTKILELDSKAIDVVWNGMTLTDEVKAGMGTSQPYMNNSQIVVVKSENADTYATVESLADASISVEDGSAGHKEVEALGYEVTAIGDQASAVTEVAAGTSDVAVIDSLMAAAMVGEGTGFEDLTTTVSLNSEEYGIGFRKESGLVELVDAFIAEKYADGTMATLAEKYGVALALIEQ